MEKASPAPKNFFHCDTTARHGSKIPHADLYHGNQHDTILDTGFRREVFMYVSHPKRLLIMNILDVLKRYTDFQAHPVQPVQGIGGKTGRAVQYVFPIPR